IAAALVAGGALGLLAGLGRGVDQVLGRAMDVFFAFPPVLLAIGIAAVLGAGPGTAVVAIAVVYAPLFFRVVRASVLAESAQAYVEAAEALGLGRLAILVSHILPNVVSPIVVQTAVCLSYGILIESALSYLGLGVQPPTPSWGTILNEGKEFLAQAPWVSLFPGGATMLAVLAFNVADEGVRGERVVDRAHEIVQRDPAHPLGAAADGPPRAQTEGREHRGEGAAAAAQRHADPEPHDADPGVRGGLGGGLPLAADLGEKARARRALLAEELRAAVAVVADGGGGDEDARRALEPGE